MTNKKILMYEKILTTIETIIAFERQTGFIKSMLADDKVDSSKVVDSK